ncbi:MAG TPA: type III PLP-dependent enzyme [Candidatus Saccharimonadales bacterium]|nr:type III PLP-dependent enzyme [Candidatus Saccharimonadales bacterium]
MDLAIVGAAYQNFRRLLPDVAVHYAMKCNPARRILQTLHQAGCGFEVASYPELQALLAVGVDPAGVLFSNPVKVPGHISQAYQAGVRVYSFDSAAEVDKLARLAPGSKVSVRLRTTPAGSEVASEGKFGVDVRQAGHLLHYAASLGLVPWGIAFHVGSQMQDPGAWDVAIRQSSQLMRRLRRRGVTLGLLDMGGGFPTQYAGVVPPLDVFAAGITQSLAAHLPYPVQLAIEPGRALVGEAGVMVATVIGVAERAGKRWLHLDVGAFNGLMEALETRNQLAFPLADSRDDPIKLRYHLTGPTCDSQDTIMYDAQLSRNLEVGDRVYIATAGAYTVSYASRFNGFEIPQIRYA